MRCPSCEHENDVGAKFCEACGAKLVQVCLSCGQQAKPTARFCPECGTPLVAEGQQLAAKKRTRQAIHRARKTPRRVAFTTAMQPSPTPHEAERRQLTVMFCDVVGSTALSAQLDPEELREVLQQYQQTCTAVIRRYAGYVAQHLGDGLLVYFGYPVAHEDEVARAVRAGLEIIAALRASPLQHRQLPIPLQIRVGVHTGVVVIGEIGSSEKREILALGETPNLAARLQGLAEPDTIVMSAATQHLIAGLFDCQDLGLQSVKGVAAAVRVYRVLSESSTQSRLEVAVSTGKLTPLVGRAHEVGLILERWAAARAGDGQGILLSGEPGIGKSRLVQEVKERVEEQGALCLEFRCSPYFQNSAFYPVLTHLQRLLRWQRDDPPEAKREKLQQLLTRYRFAQADTVPLLAALLSLPQPEGTPPLALSPQKQKQKTQEALVAWLVEEAEQAPVYCIWEDVHWADPSTIELLGLLLAQVPMTRLLVVLTARPEFTPPWSSTQVAPLILTRLPRTQTADLIVEVTGGKPLPPEVQRHIVSKTDGVPLFVEELTKMVLESGLLRERDGHYELTGPLPPLAIPATLHDSLMARLDRLATVKEVTQLGATLGREFSYEVLQAVSPVDETSLQQTLGKLVEAEVLYQRGVPPQAHYLFKHALIQDAAYQSLLKSTRQQYHAKIAQMLEHQFAEIMDTQPELLAHHYTEAGLVAQAIPYWQRAGERAVQRSANEEAINYLTQAISRLQALPPTREHSERELSLQIALGAPLNNTKGWAAPEVGDTYTRALTLCQQLGRTDQLFPILRGLWQYYQCRVEHQRACYFADQILAYAQEKQDAALLVSAHNVQADTLTWLGEFVSAKAHAEEGAALYNRQHHHWLAFTYGDDPGLICHCYAALTLWHLGYPDQARKRVQEALTLAYALKHPFSRGWALCFAAIVGFSVGDERAALEKLEELRRLSDGQGFAFWLPWALVLGGHIRAEQGHGAEEIAHIQEGLLAWGATGLEILRPWFLTLLAEAQGQVGQLAEGLHAVSESLALVAHTGERWAEAESYRVKGKLMLQQASQQANGKEQKAIIESDPRFLLRDAQGEAEGCFVKAIKTARQQQAKSLELRVTVSLARLWQEQGKKAEAHQLLSEIYGWFIEGFDTKDLQEAKTLLEELH